MPYAETSDLIERFGEKELRELTDRANKPPTTIDDVVVGRALDDASGLIDGYLGAVYALPLAAVPAELVKAAADIARYYLHGKSAEKDGAVARAHGEALAWLKDVSAGRVRIQGASAGSAAEPAPGAAGRVAGSRAVFTRDSLRGFS